MRLPVAFAGALMLAGCVTAPASYNFDKSVMISRDFDTSWEAVSEFFTSNNIQIKTIEKASGIVYAERINQVPRVPGMIGDIGDCGSPGLASVQQQSVQLNVFAKRYGHNTRMTVNTVMNETRCMSGGCHTVSCNSTGRLENSLINFVRTS